MFQSDGFCLIFILVISWNGVLHMDKSNYNARGDGVVKRILFLALCFDKLSYFKIFVVLIALTQFYFQEFESVEKE